MNKDTNFTNFEKEIQSILQSHTEVPPSSCWGDIVSQLDNTIANNNLLNNTSTNAKKLISGKIGLTITAISTLCIVGLFYIYSNSDRNKENNNNKETFLTPITQINTQETTNDTTFFNTGEHTKNQIVDTSLYSEDISILPKDTFLETTTIADTTTYVLADTISELKTEQIVNIDKNSSAKQATTAVSKNETNQNFNSSSIEKSEDNTKGFLLNEIMRLEKVLPSEMLMLGDKVDVDIEPAKKLGINAELVKSLDEILPKIEKIENCIK